MTGIDLNGQRASVRFGGNQPTVLYYFSPTCHWCERNWNNVKALASASAGRFRLIGIASEPDLRAFAQKRELGFELIGGISPDTLAAFGLGGTPHTLVVSSQGRISHEWSGAFEGRRKRSVEDFFAVDLPGLLPDSKTLVSR